ncbi:hypothetical protein [Methylorubrum sp. SB2]
MNPISIGGMPTANNRLAAKLMSAPNSKFIIGIIETVEHRCAKNDRFSVD